MKILAVWETRKTWQLIVSFYSLNKEFQLGQVKEALSKDTENADLLKLQSDLLELVNLYTTLASQETEKSSQPVIKPLVKPPTAKTSSGFSGTGKAPLAKAEKESSDLVVGHVEEKKEKKKYTAKKERKPSKRDLEFNQKQEDWKKFTNKKAKLSQKKAIFTTSKSDF